MFDAVAIHNARLYEWAEIYAEERQELLVQAGPAHSVRKKGSRRPGLPFEQWSP
jgi:hypothetical protein